MKNKPIPKQARKENYKKLSYRYRLLSDFMDSIPDVIYFKDKTGRLIMVNRAHAKGLGLEPDEVIGKTDFDFFPRERAKKMAEDDAYVLKKKRPIIDKIERATRPDGIDNFVSTTKIPRYDNKGNVIGLMGITRDITRRVQQELLKEERERSEKKLSALKELNKIKSEFVSVVSHELRTPISIVKEAIMLILEELAGPITQKQKELLTKARKNVGRLANIIEDLLDLSRIEKGTLRLHYSLVNLNDLIMDSAEFFLKWAHEKSIDLTYALPREQINIFIDAEKIIRVISNLVNNAIKFTEEKGEIKVEVKILEDKVRVAVMDNGIGIRKQDLPLLFNKFVQAPNQPGLQGKGLGLGLSIAKNLIERHGGEIWVESTPGVGSSFYFTLPQLYTTNALNRRMRDKINSLLEKETPLYIIGLSIINFNEFKKMAGIDSDRLFMNLKSAIEGALSELPSPGIILPEIALRDYSNGICSIIYPEATEQKALKLCELLKNKIEEYFARNKVRNVFINVGILSYPAKEGTSTTQRLFANLYVKKLYIGSETRRFKRVSYKVDIKLVLPDNKAENSQTVDISQGGICFISKSPLKTDTRINFSLYPFSKRRPVHITGRVAWIKKIEDLTGEIVNKYKVGVEFISINSKDRKEFSRLNSQVFSGEAGNKNRYNK